MAATSNLTDWIVKSESFGQGPAPKYLQLSQAISDAIDAGELKPGERLPGEANLTARLPYSLGTVQKALANLSSLGIVHRKHGAGTFVSGQNSQLQDLWHFRFLGNDATRLLPVYTRVTAIEQTSGKGPWSEFLGAVGDVKSLKLIRIDRLLNVNEEFDGVSHLYLPEASCPDLAHQRPSSLNGVNLRTYIKSRFGISTRRVVEQIGVEILPAPICTLLGMDENCLGMVCHILGYGFKDHPVSYQAVYLPPNSRRLEFSSDDNLQEAFIDQRN